MNKTKKVIFFCFSHFLLIHRLMILILVYTWEIQDKNNVHFATLLNERELILCSILLILHTG